MSVTNDLFSIKEITHGDGVVQAVLGIDTESEILKGHFPGHPVVPGACMLQITKEVLENALKLSIQLKKADQLKFLNMIDPTNTSMVDLAIVYKYQDGELIIANAKINKGDLTCFKFQGTFEVR